MATPQTQRPQSQGLDILSRMLHMEKVSQRQRSPNPHAQSPSMASPKSPSSPSLNNAMPQRPVHHLNHRSISSPLVSQRSSHYSSPQPPVSPASQKRYSPDLKVRIPDQSEPLPTPPITITPLSTQPVDIPKIGTPPSPTSICHSPSWSDYGGEKRKKERKRQERLRKEVEKQAERAKKEAERSPPAASRPPKRLSKKPPAAMDTQRMPVALTRPSESQSSRSGRTSGDNSRPSSREGKRSSVSSIASMLRLSRTNSETKLAELEGSSVSPSFAQLPAGEARSRRGSTSSLSSLLKFGRRGSETKLPLEPTNDSGTSLQKQREEISRSVARASRNLSNSPVFNRDSDDEGVYMKSSGRRDAVSFSRPRQPTSSGQQRPDVVLNSFNTSADVTPTVHGIAGDSPRDASQWSEERQLGRHQSPARPGSSRETRLGMQQETRASTYSPPAAPRSAMTDREARMAAIKAAVANDMARYRKKTPTLPARSRETTPIIPQRENLPSPKASFVHSPKASSDDGYVQRQRLNQQQRSIAHLNEGQALKNGMYPPTPDDSTESFQRDSFFTRINQLDSESPIVRPLVVRPKTPNTEALPKAGSPVPATNSTDAEAQHPSSREKVGLGTANATVKSRPQTSESDYSEPETAAPPTILRSRASATTVLTVSPTVVQVRHSQKPISRERSNESFTTASSMIGNKASGQGTISRGRSTDSLRNSDREKTPVSESDSLNYPSKIIGRPRPRHRAGSKASLKKSAEAIVANGSDLPALPTTIGSSSTPTPSVDAQTIHPNALFADIAKMAPDFGNVDDSPTSTTEPRTVELSDDYEVPDAPSIVPTPDNFKSRQGQMPIGLGLMGMGDMDQEEEVVNETPEPSAVKVEQNELNVAPESRLNMETTGANGFVKLPSLKKHRSDPELNVAKGPVVPSLDFLPQLRHQPLPKPARTSLSRSPPRVSFAAEPLPAMSASMNSSRSSSSLERAEKSSPGSPQLTPILKSGSAQSPRRSNFVAPLLSPLHVPSPLSRSAPVSPGAAPSTSGSSSPARPARLQAPGASPRPQTASGPVGSPQQFGSIQSRLQPTAENGSSEESTPVIETYQPSGSNSPATGTGELPRIQSMPPSFYPLTPPASSSSSLRSSIGFSSQRPPALRASSAMSLSNSHQFATSRGSQLLSSSVNAKPVAKMFIICCKCTRWHDLPSKLYEAMVTPRSLRREDGIAEVRKISHGEGSNGGSPSASGHGSPNVNASPRRSFWGRSPKIDKGKEDKGKATAAAAQAQAQAQAQAAAQAQAESQTKVFTSVQCPWCEHGMGTGCCAGWTTIVYLHERHH